MDWFIRFALGLKARPEDAKALLEALPELRDRDIRFERRHFFYFFEPDFHTNTELIEALRKWASGVKFPEDEILTDYSDCKSDNCPLRSSKERRKHADDSFIAQLFW